MVDGPRKEPERRILAIVLPELLCELVELGKWCVSAAPRSKDSGYPRFRRRRDPFGVVLSEEPVLRGSAPHLEGQSIKRVDVPGSARTRLDAVNSVARKSGVYPGQTVVEACALVSGLQVTVLPRTELRQALGKIAEVGLGFGSPVSFEEPDTVWVDVTGASELWGGEIELGREFAGRVRALGHRVRMSIASGKELSRAFARWSVPERAGEVQVVSAEQTRSALAELPILALPLREETRGYLVRLGVIAVGDLMQLPQSALAARLGEQAPRILALCRGDDPEPLDPYAPPRVLVEEEQWEEPLTMVEPLCFLLRGLIGKIAARLEGRGEAAGFLRLTLEYDRKIAEFRGASPLRELEFKLALPLSKEQEIQRVIGSRLERLELGAPCVGLKLEILELTEAPRRQLALASGHRGHAEAALPGVLAELSADIGEARVGVLRLLDAHRPELKSALFPVAFTAAANLDMKRSRAAARVGCAGQASGVAIPTRLLPKPIQIATALEVGATFALGKELFTIERMSFEQRLEAVEWWAHSAVQRDYLRLWLRNANGLLEALAYVDRENQKKYIQGVMD